MDDPAQSPNDAVVHRRRRTTLTVVFVLTCAALFVGCWGFMPYFIREHRRLEPWKAVLFFAITGPAHRASDFWVWV